MMEYAETDDPKFSEPKEPKEAEERWGINNIAHVILLVGIVASLAMLSFAFIKIDKADKEIKEIQDQSKENPSLIAPFGYEVYALCTYWSDEKCNQVVFSELQNRYVFAGNTITAYEQCKDSCLEHTHTDKKKGYDPIAQSAGTAIKQAEEQGEEK